MIVLIDDDDVTGVIESDDKNKTYNKAGWIIQNSEWSKKETGILSKIMEIKKKKILLSDGLIRKFCEIHNWKLNGSCYTGRLQMFFSTFDFCFSRS